MNMGRISIYVFISEMFCSVVVQVFASLVKLMPKYFFLLMLFSLPFFLSTSNFVFEVEDILLQYLSF